MGHIEATKHLAASPDAIWATVSDPRTWEQWLAIHAGWLEEPPATLTQGAKLTEKITMLGMANKLEWTIDTLEAPNLIVLSGTGMAGVKVQFSFAVTPDGDGATFRVTGDFEGALIKGALGKAVEKDGAKNLESSMAKLAQLADA